ncbi:MAG: hypothetical protein ACK4SZ_10310 [Allosphingosinicella sp.]|uniref:hypothetical protein n=1 Tax=Allosphingosinicella sp. TaxID=2823234 RepID=UPI003954ADA1
MSRRARRAARAGTAARAPRMPLLPAAVALSAVAVLAAAWTTSWAPGEGRAAEPPTSFTLEIPAAQQRMINSWERFFICYDLLDPQIVDLTLRANQRATGSLDFPGERVEVQLPGAPAEDAAAPPAGGEDELIRTRQSVLDSAVPARMAQIRQQCAGGTGA